MSVHEQSVGIGLCLRLLMIRSYLGVLTQKKKYTSGWDYAGMAILHANILCVCMLDVPLFPRPFVLESWYISWLQCVTIVASCVSVVVSDWLTTQIHTSLDAIIVTFDPSDHPLSSNPRGVFGWA